MGSIFVIIVLASQSLTVEPAPVSVSYNAPGLSCETAIENEVRDDSDMVISYDVVTRCEGKVVCEGYGRCSLGGGNEIVIEDGEK